MNPKEELVEILTVQVALDDKLHKFQEVLTNIAIRINKLEDIIKEKE